MGFLKLVSFVWAKMQHLARIIGLLLAVGCQQVQPLREDDYPYASEHNGNGQTSRRRLTPHDYDGHDYSQQQIAPYGQPQLVQMPAFRNQANQVLYGYGTAGGTPTNTQPRQHWSGAPIVVDYGGDYLEQQQQQQRTPLQSNYALPPTPGAAANPSFLSSPTAEANLQSHAPQSFSVDPNNGNNYNSRDLAGHLNRQPAVQQQQYLQQQLPPPIHYQQEQSLRSPTRYELPQLPPYYHQQQHWPNAIPTRDNAAKYAAHFASYVRKYPYRLQPIFQPNDYKKR